tara:strand:+ start:289 stop:627 length:339 start_codon:yes stop_codon:yes gene_type:complete
MKIIEKKPSRVFKVGAKGTKIHHVADIELGSDEQVTFLGENDSEYDFVKKSWGYYASPSINKRLKAFNIRSFLVKNETGHIYLMCVDRQRIKEFENYCEKECQQVFMELTNY